MNDKAIKRVRLLVRILFFWSALIVARLIQLQVIDHAEYQRLALKQQEKTVELHAERGKILDRDGQVLAISRPLDSVVVNPLRVPDLSVAADILSKILHVDAPSLLDKMQEAAADGRGFMWVKRRISDEESESVHSLGFEWIEFRKEYQRFYPNNRLASQVIGSVDFDQNGNAGIEQSLNDELLGHDGELLVTTDVQRNGFDSRMSDRPEPGRDIRLTIDTRIQRVAELELKAAVEQHHCKTGSVVVLDPATGDILALASYPDFDPNEPVKPGADLSNRTNLAITTPFEPGSVFKVITLSTALETTRLVPGTVIPCGNGSLTMFGRTVHDHKSYAALTMEDVLVHSSNIGAIHVGMTVGAPKLYDYIRRFRFGQRTGIVLPGESPGLVHKLKAWQPTSIMSVPMGHEIMVTTLQLAQACGIVANNGFWVKPRITLDTPMAQPVPVLDPKTAITMRQMMENVVIRGTGKLARLDDYTTGGKTGTAQIVDLKSHTYSHLYNASFMGFAPVNNPRLVVVVTVNGASGLEGYGGTASAPAFKKIASTALRMRDVPPDVPTAVMLADDVKKVDTNDLADAGTDVPNLLPDDDPPAAQGQGTVPATQASVQTIGPKVPDFHGMTMQAVLERSTELGIPVEFIGAGLVRDQRPRPGNVLPLGERVRVQFRP